MTLRLLDLTQLYRLIDGWIRFRPIAMGDLIKRVAYYHEIARQRSQLRKLSDDQLKDIGISRSEALAEANKPFWED